MELLIALLIALAAFILGYNVLYRRHVLRSVSEKRVAAAYSFQQILSEADPKSPEYRLAAAGIQTRNPKLTWTLLHYGPALAACVIALGVGMPPFVALGAALIGFIAPRQWLEGRIKDRGRRLEADLPQVYVELLATLRANPDVASALSEVADGLEREKGANPMSDELRQTAREAASSTVGREQAFRNLQRRAASVSLANLGLLLERFAQTGAGDGGSFFDAFAAGAGNVQSIIEARQRAQSKAAEQMMSARIVPALLAFTLVFFMGDVSFRQSFQLPMVQLILAGAAVIMYLGYLVMSDMAREAV
jgi:Flp pilus assembly protein TadB